MKKIRLSIEEMKVLNRIATKSGMDCWFSLRCGVSKGEAYDYVFDMEERKVMSLRSGIRDLMDGMIDQNYDLLDDAQKIVLIKLLAKLI